jgi:hypothetical protein
VKCARPTCSRKAGHGGRNRGLCELHYKLTDKGYVDVARARAHLIALNESGFSWRHIARLTGLTEQGLYRVRDGERCQRVTEAKILAVPTPKALAGPGRINAVGSQRRIRALQALGWTQRNLEDRLGLHPRRLSTVLVRPKIYTPMARKIADVYDELSMLPGPSEKTRNMARNKGWPVPLCWDDETIDDPNAEPNTGERAYVSAADRINELRELGITDKRAIASRLGIQPKSVERAIERSAA